MRSSAHGLRVGPNAECLGRRAHRELVAVGLADDDRAGALEPLRRPWRRRAARSARASASGGRRHAARAQVVLERDRHAEPAARRASGRARGRCRGARASARSAVTVLKACSAGSSASMRVSASRHTSAAERAPSAPRRANRGPSRRPLMPMHPWYFEEPARRDRRRAPAASDVVAIERGLGSSSRAARGARPPDAPWAARRTCRSAAPARRRRGCSPSCRGEADRLRLRRARGAPARRSRSTVARDVRHADRYMRGMVRAQGLTHQTCRRRRQRGIPANTRRAGARGR